MASISSDGNPTEHSPMEIAPPPPSPSPPSPPPLEIHANWLELPRDVTLMILMKLAPVHVLESTQFVCKYWYNLCKDPSMWRTFRFQNLDEPELATKHEAMVCNVVDRSSGGLLDLDIEGFGSDHLLSYIANRSSQLKRLRLACCYCISAEALIEAFEKLSSLEELDLTLCSFPEDKSVLIIQSCPPVTTFRLNEQGSRNPTLACDKEALAIAEFMPEVRHLQLIGNSMSNKGLEAILDGCLALQSLDMRACFQLELMGDLGKRLSEQVMDVKRPYDSTDDYNYLTTDYDSDFDEIYPDEYEDMDFVSDDDIYDFSDENEVDYDLEYY